MKNMKHKICEGHLIGMSKVGGRGQVVIPKEVRDLFGIKAGDNLIIIGDEGERIVLIKPEQLEEFATRLLQSVKNIKGSKGTKFLKKTSIDSFA
ncbi:MAG: AbrB/MazE/SpoVT family DNA-binding domain-containing protein [Candidatus Diapherotrites archaeon]